MSASNTSNMGRVQKRSRVNESRLTGTFGQNVIVKSRSGSQDRITSANNSNNHQKKTSIERKIYREDFKRPDTTSPVYEREIH